MRVLFGVLLCLPQLAVASGLNEDACADAWEQFFDAQNEVVFRTRNVPVLGRSLVREPKPTMVAACRVVPEETSQVREWNGYAQFDVTGTAQVVGVCTAIDVVEVHGKADDRCRRFRSARLCRNVDDPSLVMIERGESEAVRCPGD